MTLKIQKFWKKGNLTFFAEKSWENIVTYFQKFSAKIGMYEWVLFLGKSTYVCTKTKLEYPQVKLVYSGNIEKKSGRLIISMNDIT